MATGKSRSLPRQMTTEYGREVRLYPNVVEVWQDGRMLVGFTPQEWGSIARWVEGEVRTIAEERGPLGL